MGVNEILRARCGAEEQDKMRMSLPGTVLLEGSSNRVVVDEQSEVCASTSIVGF